MTVIDVNTGKFTGQGGNLEETVTRNNLEAAEEIVRQLRLRDVGGIVVIDFIDMVLESNRELVLRRLLECLARDRTKHQVAEVTSLGLVQMTRKRVGAGLLEAFSTPCECCNGRGVILTFDQDADSQALHHTHGRGNGGNVGRVPAPAAMASPASVAARSRPAETPRPPPASRPPRCLRLTPASRTARRRTATSQTPRPRTPRPRTPGKPSGWATSRARAPRITARPRALGLSPRAPAAAAAAVASPQPPRSPWRQPPLIPQPLRRPLHPRRPLPRTCPKPGTVPPEAHDGAGFV